MKSLRTGKGLGMTGFEKALNRLTKGRVLVGIPAGSPTRQPEEGEKGAPINNATLGYIQETGSPARNIPARPFLKPGVADAKDKIVAQMKKGSQAVFGAATEPAAVVAAHNALDAVGLVAQAAVKAKITSNVQPALAQSTLDKRKARGVTRTNTLIDSGQLAASITYVIEG